MIDSDKLVLMEFGAEWCSPCRVQEPILAELASEYSEILEVRKVDIDEHRELSERYAIRSVPTTLFFRDGEVTDMCVGLTSKEELKKRIIRAM